MNEPLHPLTLAEILDRTAQIYRSRFLVFLGIATIPAGTCLSSPRELSPSSRGWVRTPARARQLRTRWCGFSSLCWRCLWFPSACAATALGEAAMSDAAARSFLGEKITIRSAYKTAWKRGWRYVGLFLLQGLVIVVVPDVAFLIASCWPDDRSAK